MKDLSLFTTENGVASLILRKIPFTKEAFVHIRDSCACDQLLKECIDVCRMAGAEKVYAAGHENLKRYPLYCDIYRYDLSRENMGSTDAAAIPICPEQTEWWRQLYNQKMADVPAASPLTVRDTEELIREGTAYYVCRDCATIGIGVAGGGEIYAVASLLPGAGREVVLALAACTEGAVISLRVADNNEKACRLYRSLGFSASVKEESWYKIFEC